MKTQRELTEYREYLFNKAADHIVNVNQLYYDGHLYGNHKDYEAAFPLAHDVCVKGSSIEQAVNALKGKAAINYLLDIVETYYNID